MRIRICLVAGKRTVYQQIKQTPWQNKKPASAGFLFCPPQSQHHLPAGTLGCGFLPFDSFRLSLLPMIFLRRVIDYSEKRHAICAP
jgi:hypothetical protein